jgi:hypothetical protein
MHRTAAPSQVTSRAAEPGRAARAQAAKEALEARQRCDAKLRKEGTRH